MAGAGAALGYTSNEAERRRYADRLFEVGTSVAPVQHWTQALARVLQGAMGGYEMGQLRQEDQAATDALKNLPGLAPQSAPQADPTAATPPSDAKARIVSALSTPGSAPSDAPAPQPQLSPGGQRIATALGSGRSSVSIPPDVGAYIQTLMSNPRTQPQGLALYSQYVKPADYGYIQAADGTILRTDSRTGTVAPAYHVDKPANYGFQTLPDGTMVRTDPRTGTVQPVYQGPTKSTFGIVGESEGGGKQYGWIDPGRHTVEPYTAPGGGAPGMVTGPNGEPIAIPPGVDAKTFRNEISKTNADAASGKMTETQAKASSYAARMEQASAVLGKLPNQGMSGLGNAIDAIPGVGNTAATNWMQSPEYQQGRAAKSAFITALLRQESGAAISKEEFSRYDKEFFPQPGDSPLVIKQKIALQASAIDQMKRAAGPGYRSSLPSSYGNSGGGNDPLGIR